MNFDFVRKSQILNFRNLIWLLFLFQISIVSFSYGKIITSGNSKIVSDINNCIQKRICSYAEVEDTKANISGILYQSGQNHLIKCIEKYPTGKNLNIKFNIRNYNLSSKELGYELTYTENKDLKSLAITYLPCNNLQINQCKPKIENIDTIKTVAQQPVEAVKIENTNCFEPSFRDQIYGIRSEDESTYDGKVLNFAEAKYGFGFKNLENGQCEKICKEGFFSLNNENQPIQNYQLQLLGVETNTKVSSEPVINCQKCPPETIERSDKNGCFLKKSDSCDYKSELVKTEESIHCEPKCSDGFIKDLESKTCELTLEGEKKLLDYYILELEKLNSIYIPSDFKLGRCSSDRIREIISSYMNLNLVAAKVRRKSLDKNDTHFNYKIKSFIDFISNDKKQECYVKSNDTLSYTKENTELLLKLLKIGHVSDIVE